MKIGELEISDVAFEAFLKQSGKRVVEDSDYTKKAEAAADLAKFRAVTGESRSIEDIGKILKAHEENEKKNKTESELLKGELDRLTKELTKREEAIKAAQLEVRRTQVDRHFEKQMELSGMKVIEPILNEFRKPFYEMDESKLTQEQLAAQVNEALTKAAERQNQELQRLGLGNTAGAVTPAAPVPFGGVNVTPGRGVPLGADGVQAMLQSNAATPWSTPFAKTTTQPNRV